jgi:multimeric flavodoxin WrbA
MKKVLITYHSQGGNTEAMAKAVFKSANAAGAEVILQRGVDADAQHILACDIVAIGTPDHFGYMAGLVKDRFDLVRATIRDKVGDKPLRDLRQQRCRRGTSLGWRG